MNIALRSFAVSAALLLASATSSQSLSLKYGLESRHHTESNNLGMNQEWPEAKKIFSRKRVRFFQERLPHDRLMDCFSRHWTAWEKFQKVSGTSAATQDQFNRYKQQNDPGCSQFAKEIAPQLYFDFTAPGSENYVLEKIEVNTLGFGEYKGGGFFEREAWYDILLSNKPGIKTYDVDRRLTFQRTGRAVLRFWSDNFYPNAGWMAPMGAYILDIKFIFSANGRKVAVSTGPFMIDV